jgi:hypothetical protein
MRPSEPKKADWQGIIRVAQEALTDTSKDLLVTGGESARRGLS